MNKFLISAAVLAVTTGIAQAETVGVSMALFDDNFLTTLRNGMQTHADSLEGVDLTIEDATNDVAKQLSQVQNFIASGVDAIIVNPVDTSATQAMTDAAEAAGIPVVFVNRQPINVDTLPDNQAFVASNEVESGTLQTQEVCRMLTEQGVTEASILVMQGELSNQAAVVRTQDILDVIATPECSFMTIAEQQTANWNRTQATDLMSNWMSAGIEFAALVSNNDEMAIGAIQAMKSAGMSMDDVIVAGVDATPDALAAMDAGDLDVTVFQDAAGQGQGALDAALSLARGEPVEQKVYIPFQLVTPANRAEF